jgi:hypothetical protein
MNAELVRSATASESDTMLQKETPSGPRSAFCILTSARQALAKRNNLWIFLTAAMVMAPFSYYELIK